MTASDLLKISQENQIKMEDVIKECSNRAACGNVEAVFFAHFTTELISGLAYKGFKVSERIGNLGERLFIVSWL